LIAERQQIAHRVCIIRCCQQIAVRNMTKPAKHAMPPDCDWQQTRSDFDYKTIAICVCIWLWICRQPAEPDRNQAKSCIWQIENRTWFE